METLSSSGLLSRLKWVLFWRLIIAVFALGALFVYHLPIKAGFFSEPRFLAAYVILTVACFSNIIYLVLIKSVLSPVSGDKLRRLAFLQISIDIVLTSLIAYCTGGSASIFVSTYFALILAANILISARMGLFFATVSAILLSLITIIYSLSAGGHFLLPLLPVEYVKSTAEDFRFILPYLFFFTLIIHFVAYSIGRLVIALNYERLLKTEILEKMTSGIIVISPSGEVLYINPFARKILGIVSQSGLKMGIDEMINSARELFSAQKETLLNRVLTALKYEKKIAVPVILNMSIEPKSHFIPSTLSARQAVRPENSAPHPPAFLEIRISPLKVDIRPAPGRKIEHAGLIIMIDDITLKQQVDNMSKESEFLSSLREMSLSIAHEIRNPLSSIRAGVQELGRELASSDNKERQIANTEDGSILVKTIIKESDRLNNLLANFIDFTRDRKPILQKADITEILKEVVLLINQSNLSEGKINLENSNPGTDKLFCEMDTEQIKQVLYNIIINAIQSSPRILRGSGKRDDVIISIKSEPDLALIGATDSTEINSPAFSKRENVLIEVVDYGHGIPSQNIHRIFEPFFTTKPNGIGLGLSIAKRIIENHRGSINIESVPEKGTKVSVWLPRVCS
ncbi:MAG: ATP-binding protein [Planctomycetota bacterium]|nr:ATP-binding protein [Planctomycetota bacterium]MDI6787211.1 ATP-binding protein [Planctomycetota bacterium]